MSALTKVMAQIEDAKFPEDVFGELEPRALLVHRVKLLSASYRLLAHEVHPDRHSGTPLEPTATRALAALNALRKRAEDCLRSGTYGKRIVAAPAPAPTGPIVVTVGKKRYEARVLVHQGDLCDLYACSRDAADGSRERLLLKIAQHPRDNDLVEAEARSLKKLNEKPSESERIYPRLLPGLIDTFMLRGEKSTRRAVVITGHEDHHSLTDVLAAYPQGLDFRDMAWMFKRLLLALGYARLRGVVHGAVLPEHVLVHGTEHGAKLIDWCYSVPAGGRVKAVVAARRDWYAPEVLKKLPATPATDIYMAARTVLALLAGGDGSNLTALNVVNTPRAITAFLEGCLIANPARRPDDAWRLHDEFDALLARVVGPRKYRPLAMPEAR